MEELSLHILDIANNSVRAGASLIVVEVAADRAKDLLTVTISDDGCGMSDEMIKRVTDPFYTTRTTRKIGMGLPLYKQACESAGGRLTIESELGKGTVVRAEFGLTHIDRMPMGSLADSVITLVTSPENIDCLFKYSLDGSEFVFDTREVKRQLEGVSLAEPEIAVYLKEMIQENISLTDGGYSL